MKRLSLFFSFFIFISVGCSSTKNTPKIEKFTELDATTVKTLMKEYSIDVPNNWYSYLEGHNHLSHSPKELLLNKYVPQTNLYIFKKKAKKYTNINDLTIYFVKKLEKKYQNFNYDLVKGSLPLYGRYNFIIYKTNYFNKDYTTLNAIILKDNYYYTITYRALSNDYQKYADDVVKMIHSFRIKE
ncbi:hypothetical protein SAMN05216503_2860 [Polaribacter sp. KT25b]|uniref:hypothetical protein n=1 Tax=Polaribacter sp. KT25b TaxID=1855336 RepID=UPI00087A91E0|nr:hypothetical protein [Polaribacter sp. KT25b]SDS37425.1 hypothetical protein SAMN05216503_2860 [Polaribacter sp. KT25b]